MPINNFSIGKDVSLVITTPNGPLTLNGITDFSAKPATETLKSKTLDGTTRHGYIPNGWEISLKMDRLDTSADDYWNLFEAAYFAGGNQASGTIFETIREADGSISQWTYTGVVLKLDSHGDYSADKKVEQSLSGMATTRVRVS
jgi:hypothetical protein